MHPHNSAVFKDLHPLEKHPEAGFTALELIICLAVLLQIITLGGSYLRKNSEALVAKHAAEQMSLLSQATIYYVQDHFTDICQALGSNSSIAVDLQTLKEGSYLSQQFPLQNPYQQDHVIDVAPVLKDDSLGKSSTEPFKGLQVVQVLVYTSGGPSLSERTLRSITEGIGGKGGFVSINTPDQVTGSCQGWSLEIPEALNLEPGHVAALSYVNAQSMLAADTFLRRIKMTGQPQLNIMETHLGLDQNSIIQFLKAKDAQYPDPNDASRTCLGENALQFGQDCKITGQGVFFKNDYCKLTRDALILDDHLGNQVILTPNNLIFKNFNDTNTDSSILSFNALTLKGMRGESHIEPGIIRLYNNANDGVITLNCEQEKIEIQASFMEKNKWNLSLGRYFSDNFFLLYLHSSEFEWNVRGTQMKNIGSGTHFCFNLFGEDVGMQLSRWPNTSDIPPYWRNCGQHCSILLSNEVNTGSSYKNCNLDFWENRQDDGPVLTLCQSDQQGICNETFLTAYTISHEHSEDSRRLKMPILVLDLLDI